MGDPLSMAQKHCIEQRMGSAAKEVDSLHYLEAELLERIQRDPELFRFIESSSLDGMWFWDLENPEHEWMSDRMWEVIGQDPSERKHLVSEWQDLIHPEDLQLALKNFDLHCKDPNHPYDQLVRYRHPEGHWVWVRCRGLVIRDESGKPIRMIGAHNEITDLKRVEEQLRAKSEQLEKSNTDMRQFLYAVAHDLRAPLRTMNGFLEFLEEDKAILEHGQKSFDFVKSAAHRLSEMLEGLMPFIELTQETKDQKHVDLNQILKWVGNDFPEVEIESGALPLVVGQPGQLQCVLQNIISNANRYRDAERSPKLVISHEVDTKRGVVRISFRDNGVGIHKGQEERAFRIFGRCHKKEDFAEGHGLGLAVSKRIVECHGGNIWLENNQGEDAVGLTVFVELEVAPCPSEN